MNILAKLTFVTTVICFLKVTSSAQLQGFEILNEPRDISDDFSDFKNTFSIEFVSQRTVHLRAKSGFEVTKENESFLLKADPYFKAVNYK